MNVIMQPKLIVGASFFSQWYFALFGRSRNEKALFSSAPHGEAGLSHVLLQPASLASRLVVHLFICQVRQLAPVIQILNTAIQQISIRETNHILLTIET